MSNIRLLSPDLINKIAAGEVVERPASIVKELLENALDAKAKNITVKIEQGGISFIEVTDDGVGMDERNAKLAFVQHATSKISSQKDLENIFTLGFRGEALPSIGSIATTTIHTKTSENEPVLATMQDGQIISKAGAGRNTGTTITVKDIFHKIPARKKFLKSENVEYKHILNTFTKIALAYFEVSFRLIHNNKEVYHLLPAKNQEDRIIQIYPNLKGKLILTTFSDKSLALSGYIGHPSVNRRDKAIQFIFVNSRAVNEPVIASAVKTGFGTNLMHNQNPVYFLNITIDPQKVDVNVHPRKSELRFDNSQEIFKTVYNSIRKSLETHLRNELKDRFRESESAENTSNYATPKFSEKQPSFPNQTRENNFNHSLFPSSSDIRKDQGIEFTKTLLNTQIDSKELEETPTKALQIFDTYIVIEKNDNMYVIDQHAAAERITFERIKSRFEKHKTLPSQQLLLPEELALSQEEVVNLLEHKETLTQLGFDFDLKQSKVVLKAVPEITVTKNSQKFFGEILSNLSDDNRETSKEDYGLLSNVIATIACHSSIRAGQRLEDLQIKQLVSDLMECQQPYSCPHGRPIIWVVNKNELEKNFKRKL